MSIQKKIGPRTPTACARRNTTGYLKKVVKKILRQAQHGHINLEHLPGAIRRKLHSKGFKLHSKIVIERPREIPNMLRAMFTASRRAITVPMTIERIHSVPMQGNS